ncbi:MAG: TIGR04076 family protein [Actinomycetota bacterium]
MVLNHKDMRLIVEVAEIKGVCPVYKRGDQFIIEDGYRLKSPRDICMHSLSSILPYYVALSRGINPKHLGLASSEDAEASYVQCLDPCRYTGGGTVIFKIARRCHENKDKHP